ncbi:hypothetical protein RIF29_24994 [Crotalaria pallida]|uniref:Uncharacterized protein n=1 Tax=Crotalaria pallida TaxID=3830 RepID=A0AAN9HYX0_CROPI
MSTVKFLAHGDLGLRLIRTLCEIETSRFGRMYSCLKLALERFVPLICILHYDCRLYFEDCQYTYYSDELLNEVKDEWATYVLDELP